MAHRAPWPLAAALLAAVLSTLVSSRGASAGNWIDSADSGGIAYFLLAAPPEIRRYDMAAEAWLAPISLPQEPDAFAVDAEGLYVGSGQAVVRYALDGSSPTALAVTLVSPPLELLAAGNLLFIAQGTQLRVIDKQTGGELAAAQYSTFMTGLSIAPLRGQLFGYSADASPGDLLSVSFDADGFLGVQRDSPYHGDFLGGDRTWVLAGESGVAISSGIVYDLELNYVGSLAGSFDDLALLGDSPVVLRGRTLVSYSPALLETGRHAMAQEAQAIHTHGNRIFAFSGGSNGEIGVQAVARDQLVPLAPGPPVDPRGLAYSPDRIEMGSDGTVYLLSRVDRNIFRWSTISESYLESIPLRDEPLFMVFAAPSDRLYVAYPSGMVTEVRLSEDPTEQPLVNSPDRPCGLGAAGTFVLICAPSASRTSHLIYSPSGSLISRSIELGASREYAWSEVNRRVYYFRDGISPNDLLWEQIDESGALGASGDSPFHDDMGITYPIRAAPDGSTVILGSGRVYHGLTLDLLATLPGPISDAAFAGDSLFTLGSLGSLSAVQQWEDYARSPLIFYLRGLPLRVFPAAPGLLVITSSAGVPSFQLVEIADRDLDGDGIVDRLDNCPDNPDPSLTDTDSDGQGDPCDSDDDGDGMADAGDSAPLNPRLCADSDRDSCDDCLSGRFDPGDDGPDSDGDGLCDAFGPPRTAERYFPLTSGTRWTYATDNGPLTTTARSGPVLNGTQTTELADPSGDLQYWSSGPQGVQLHRLVFSDPELGVLTGDFSPPVRLLEPAIEPGDSISQNGTTFLTDGVDSAIVSYQSQVRVVQMGRTNTPERPYCSALVLRWDLLLTDGVDQVQGVSHLVLAPDLGLVYEIERVDGELGESWLTDSSLSLPPLDTDCDGWPDQGNACLIAAAGCADNCPYAHNPDQSDTGGLNSAAPNGKGDACECGDASGDGSVDLRDFAVLARDIAGLPPGVPEPERCALEPQGICGGDDLSALRTLLASAASDAPELCAAWQFAEPGRVFSFDREAALWRSTGGTLSDENTEFAEGAGALRHAKPLGVSHAMWRADLGGVDWRERMVRVRLKVDNPALINGGAIRLLLSHEAAAWVPANSSIWNAAMPALAAGSWVDLVFDLAGAPALQFGAGADLAQVRFIGLQAVDAAGGGQVTLIWDDLRLFP